MVDERGGDAAGYLGWFFLGAVAGAADGAVAGGFGMRSSAGLMERAKFIASP